MNTNTVGWHVQPTRSLNREVLTCHALPTSCRHKGVGKEQQGGLILLRVAEDDALRECCTSMLAC